MPPYMITSHDTINGAVSAIKSACCLDTKITRDVLHLRINIVDKLELLLKSDESEKSNFISIGIIVSEWLLTNDPLALAIQDIV